MNPPPHIPEPARSHGRAPSSDERRRIAIPRRSTKGPLDIDDPLSEPPSTSSPRITVPARNPLQHHARVLSPTRSETSPLSPQLQHHHQRHGSVKSPVVDDMPPKDFSFIQDPQAYHVLPASNIPPPFLNAPSNPPLSSPVDSLLLSGHFRLAAIAASRNILQSASPTDYESLLHLLHIRLACLCLISEHALAAQESKVLGDLTSTFYRHPLTNAHLAPWDLRLLVVRLAALGFGEWRKGIMGYYELARECRENIVKAESDQDKVMWRARLRDCGIRVANILIEMGDLESAGRHLSTLPQSSPESSSSSDLNEIRVMEILVRLRLGDVQAAKRLLEESSPTTTATAAEDDDDDDENNDENTNDLITGTLTALTHLATSNYPKATSLFQTLHTQYPHDTMVAQNLAVCLLYTGQIAASKKLLTDVVDSSLPFHSSVFNLCTVYELCTERNRDRKVQLAERLAARKVDGKVGWEIPSSDFKL
ncbi:hypothetical protein DM02DRAFT_715275 [Periconia macrospinosa]|uniref:TPR-like protein n=1 Tax=Periconia macrospinosa TaxID=97972 RepID=A0A2V1E8X5_9PLEO|nr:hypothetical protein DM02DRAFT_715275 [Periconia macrospinosa]